MLYVDSDGSIRLTRGDTARLTIDISDGETRYVIQPGDILRFSVKKSTNDSVYIFQKELEGESLLHIKPEDTRDLSYGKYCYDVELTTESGDVFTVIEPSSFEVMREVTW